MKAVDVAAALTFIAGGGFAVATVALSNAFPTDSTKIIAFAAVIAPLAGLLLRLFYNRTGAPATSVVADAPIVAPVTHTPTEATVVSTSSTVFEPSKGTP